MDKLNQWLDKYCALFPFSGIVRLTQRDEVLFQRCIGKANIELDVPITPKSRFRFYSLTKPFCAIGALMLRDRSLLSLDAHPSRYLPQTTYMHPNMTIRSLLNHSSGLPDFGESAKFNTTLQFERPPDKERLLACVRDLPIHFSPGEGSHYCNFNFFLASLIIERLAAMPFERFIEEEVFAPLGMNGAAMDSAERLVPNRASGYEFNGNTLVAAPYTAIEWMMGAGAGIGTVDDVYCLNMAIKHRLLLSDDSWTQALTPGHGNYGLGCTVSRWHGRLRYTHNGGHYGFRTLHIQLPEEDLDIIALSNFGFGNFRAAFAEAVRAAIGDAKDAGGAQPRMDPGFASPASEICDPLNPARPAPVALTEQQQEEYVGEYVNDTGSQRISVVFEDGQWSIAFGDGSRRMEVYPCGADSFFHCHIDEKYTFDRDEKGLSFWGMRKQE
ncbi:MAG: beta-lactamase family protein [Clostridiaceae bacterium]|nr:beta-lactamase family protein [Clostridiaceae bacterium]